MATKEPRPHSDRALREHDEDAFAKRNGGAFQRGQRAKRRGAEIWVCPFKDSTSFAARAWREGWRSVEVGSPGPTEHEQPRRRRRPRPPSQTCLAVETVLAIRRARKAGESITVIHRRFGISYQACWLITTRRSWKHLPEEADAHAEDRNAGEAPPDMVVSGV